MFNWRNPSHTTTFHNDLGKTVMENACKSDVDYLLNLCKGNHETLRCSTLGGNCAGICDCQSMRGAKFCEWCLRAVRRWCMTDDDVWCVARAAWCTAHGLMIRKFILQWTVITLTLIYTYHRELLVTTCKLLLASLGFWAWHCLYMFNGFLGLFDMASGYISKNNIEGLLRGAWTKRRLLGLRST